MRDTQAVGSYARGVMRTAWLSLIVVLLAGPSRAQPPAEADGPLPADTPPSEQDAPAAEAETPEAPEGETPDAPEGEVAEGEAPEPAALRVVVVDAAPYGVDPVVGRAVTRRMRETAVELGYDVIAGEDTVAAARRLRMPYPPSPADLWRVTFVAEAQRGAFARVWAHEGRYVFELSVASLDGGGPFFARGTSTADDLREVVDRLMREALPLPATYDPEEAARLATRTEPEERAPTHVEVAAPPPTPVARPVIVRRPSRTLRPTRRFDLVLQTEGAIGTSSDGFYNHLIGIRLGLRITNAIHIGLYGAYANLKGRGNRAQNFLTMFMLEDRIRLSSRSDITVPIRAAIGYLPFNGPVLRLSAGINIPLSPRFEVGFDILTPTFWFLPDQTVVSLNIAAELIYRL